MSQETFKETFILRTEWFKSISKLDPQDQATMLRNLFNYHIGGPIDLESFPVMLLWNIIEDTLSRNIDTYDKKLAANRENGKLGGRPSTKTNTETQINPNNHMVISPITQVEPITLSDSVYVSDNVSVSESESVHAAEIHTPIEKLKNYSDLSLPAPGTDTAHEIYYETEICHRHGFDIETVKDIHTAWVGDRLGQMFTMQEARQNFASYCAKWKQNNRNRNGTSSNIKQLPTSNKVNSSYLS